MKTGLFLSLLLVAGFNFFLPGEVFFLLMIVLIVLITPSDKAVIYNSSFSIILPFLLLVCVGVIRGLDTPNKDFYRDVFIFSKNIIYFIGGIALSKYLKDFNTFFRYFLNLAFIAALIHIGIFVTHIQAGSSLESIRSTAGYGNSVEGIMLAVFVSRMF
ncbi:MAG TPA: hypothetical protein VN958_07260, partial [Chitinophagaceae bacterium]|nr:hypothetical protein [Chitinophagaceae bacterium]